MTFTFKKAKIAKKDFKELEVGSKYKDGMGVVWFIVGDSHVDGLLIGEHYSHVAGTKHHLLKPFSKNGKYRGELCHEEYNLIIKLKEV